MREIGIKRRRGINGRKRNKWEKGDKPGFGTALQAKQATQQMTKSCSISPLDSSPKSVFHPIFVPPGKERGELREENEAITAFCPLPGRVCCTLTPHT